MSKYKNEMALGAFTLASAVILGFMSLKVGKFHFGPTTNVKAVFESASGVVKDAVVMVAGVEVGQVREIKLEDNKAVLEIRLNEDVKISKNVKAVVRAKSLLGEKFVELVPFKSNEVLQNGDVITNTITPVELDQITTTLGPILLKLGPVLEQIDPRDITDIFKTLTKSLKGKEENIARIITNTDSLLSFLKSNENKFGNIVSNLNSLGVEAKVLISDNKPAINRIVANTDKLMNNFGGRSDKLAERVDNIVVSLEDITKNLQKKSPALIDKVDVISDDIKVITSDFRKNSPDLAKKVNSITTNLDSMLSKLQKDAPDLAKDLGTITSDLAKISKQLSSKGPTIIENSDQLLAKLVVTLNKLDPLMGRLEKFDDKAIVQEVERVLRQVGIKIHLY